MADINREKTLFLNDQLTFYFQHIGNETNKNFKRFNLNWFQRRLEAFKYYKIINNKKFSTFDYLLTATLTFFLKYLCFCMNKIKQYLSKIMLR